MFCCTRGPGHARRASQSLTMTQLVTRRLDVIYAPRLVCKSMSLRYKANFISTSRKICPWTDPSARRICEEGSRAVDCYRLQAPVPGMIDSYPRATVEASQNYAWLIATRYLYAADRATITSIMHVIVLRKLHVFFNSNDRVHMRGW